MSLLLVRPEFYLSDAIDPQLFDSKLFIEKVFDEVARAPSALVNEGSSTKNLWHEGQKKKAPKVPSVAKMYTQRIKEVKK